MSKQPLKKKPRRVTLRAGTANVLSGQALLDDMEQYRKEVTATPEAARAFLMRLGVLTKDGKRRNLIRD